MKEKNTSSKLTLAEGTHDKDLQKQWRYPLASCMYEMMNIEFSNF